jgi:ADP-ribosylglycohydrolase
MERSTVGSKTGGGTGGGSTEDVTKGNSNKTVSVGSANNKTGGGGGSTVSSTVDYCSGYNPGGPSDKIAGLLFGHALGDAVGFTTEFVEELPDVITFPYTESIRKVVPCDWTDDTDLLILTMGSLMENNMTFVSKELAGRFVYWIHKGLIYTGDTEPKTPNNTFKYIVGKPNYIEDPGKIARAVLEESKGVLCNNSPMTRIAIIGTLRSPTPMAVDLCTMTHTDSRCVASCVFLGCVINSLIYNRNHTANNVTKYIESATTEALKYLDESHHVDFRGVIANSMRSQVKNLKLGELARASNVYKCLSCIVYGMHIIKTTLSARESQNKQGLYPDFKKCIEKIALEGGDADANCAMVGSILGCWLGYSRLPRDWLDAMPNAGSLNQFVAVYISRLFAPTTFEDNAVAVEKNEKVETGVSETMVSETGVSETGVSETGVSENVHTECINDNTVSDTTVNDNTVSEKVQETPQHSVHINSAPNVVKQDTMAGSFGSLIIDPALISDN